MSEKNEVFGAVSIETIEKLAEIVKANDIGEITVKADNCGSITIKGKKCPPPVPSAMPFPVMGAAAVPSVSAPAANTNASEKEETVDGNIVKSPIVGTFYSASSPDAEPFVKVGSKVKKGDVIMIIESMKLMNEVQSDFDGVVEKILVENGQAVEFDQPIMIIK